MKRKGFTLVELIVVITIIGILATMGLASLLDARESARDARRQSDLAQLRLALALYFEDYQSYPPPVAGSGAGPDISLTTDPGTIFSENSNPLVPAQMSKRLIDPDNSPTFYYFYDTNQNIGHRNYILCYLKESVNYNAHFFYSTGISGDADVCPGLPAS